VCRAEAARCGPERPRSTICQRPGSARSSSSPAGSSTSRSGSGRAGPGLSAPSGPRRWNAVSSCAGERVGALAGGECPAGSERFLARTRAPLRGHRHQADLVANVPPSSKARDEAARERMLAGKVATPKANLPQGQARRRSGRRCRGLRSLPEATAWGARRRARTGREVSREARTGPTRCSGLLGALAGIMRACCAVGAPPSPRASPRPRPP
jgi:hypothetical protein